MRLIICALLVASVVCSQEGVEWTRNAKYFEFDLKIKVYQEAEKAISHVKTIQYSLRKNVDDFIQHSESKINSSYISAMKEINSLKFESPLECFIKAAVELENAEIAALSHVRDCFLKSKANQDLDAFDRQANIVIQDILNDVDGLMNGILLCSEMDQFEICVENVAEAELNNLLQEFPKVEKLGIIAEQLYEDIEVELKTCINIPRLIKLEEGLIKAALKRFYDCFQAKDSS